MHEEMLSKTEGFFITQNAKNKVFNLKLFFFNIQV